MARASNSLPTPDSPSISTGMLDLAARSARRSVRAMLSTLVPMSLKLSSPVERRVARRSSSSSASTRSAFLIETCRRSAPTGLTTKSIAPARIAEITASIEPCAVCTIAGIVTPRWRMRVSTPMPSRSGMTRSSTRRLIRGRSVASTRASAASPDSALSTSYPNRRAMASSNRRCIGSSSTTRIKAAMKLPFCAILAIASPLGSSNTVKVLLMSSRFDATRSQN